MNVMSSSVGWREWAALPDLGVPAIKAKIDTGARTSALNAVNIERFNADGKDMVRFIIQPLQRNTTVVIRVEAPLIDMRSVRDSGGHTEQRCVISSRLRMGALDKDIDITLTERNNMLFRMLVGRTALAKSVLVDPAASFLCGRKNAKQLYTSQIDAKT